MVHVVAVSPFLGYHTPKERGPVASHPDGCRSDQRTVGMDPGLGVVVEGVPPHAPALVLNADYRPLSYFPLSLWPWQEAVKSVFLDRVNVVCEYDTVIHSPSLEIHLPSVISLKEFVNTARMPAFTRFNVFLRDRFTCQYCGRRFPTHELTFDHVVPRSWGGRTTWENVVTACAACNLRKSNRTPKTAAMPLLRDPKSPSHHFLQDVGRSFPPNFLHESWRDYLYWDTELDPW